MNEKEEKKTCLNCWIEGNPEDVEQLKSAIIENRGDAQILLWSNSNLELTKIDAPEKTKEKASINGKVYAYAPNEGKVEDIFVAKGEPRPSERWAGRIDIRSYLSICTSNDILHPIELIHDGIELGFNMEYCRPANQEEVDLLKKILYEHDLV